MFYRPRSESDKIKIFRLLDSRMELLENDKKYYFNLKKGFEGEVMFDKLTEKLQSDSLILNDLLLKSNNASFQIDSFIIQET